MKTDNANTFADPKNLYIPCFNGILANKKKVKKKN